MSKNNISQATSQNNNAQQSNTTAQSSIAPSVDEIKKENKRIEELERIVQKTQKENAETRERVRHEQEKLDGRFDELVRKSIDEREQLTQKIEINSNPSPMIITFIVVLCIIIAYMIYVIFIKNSMQGAWLDQNDEMWEIMHSKLKNEIYVVPPKQSGIAGKVVGAGIFLENGYHGLWNYGNNIEFYHKGTPLVLLQRLQN
jgi:hypothetical protein